MKRVLLLFLLALSAVGPRASAQASLRGDLDNWRTYNVLFLFTRTAPNGWLGSDSLATVLAASAGATPAQQIFQETGIKRGGASSAKMMTREQAGFILPGAIANAQIVVEDFTDPSAGISFEGGLPISSRVDSVSAWVRCEPRGSDEGYLLAQAVSTRGTATTDDDTVVGIGAVSIPATGAAFQRFTAAIEYVTTAITPDRLVVVAASGSLDPDVILASTDSTTVYFDDITYTGAMGITRPVRADAPAVRIFPNPATDLLAVEVESPEAMRIHTYDAAGRAVHAQEFRRATQVDVRRLPAGLYTYRIQDAQNRFVQSGTFSVAPR